MLVGLVVGWLSFSYKATPLYATVISLVLPIVTTQVVFSGGQWTGSSSGLVGYGTLPFGLVGFFRLAGICLLVLRSPLVLRGARTPQAARRHSRQ